MSCSPFLREQIRSVWPDVIVCLGNFASQFVLRTNKGVMSLRGQLHQAGHFVVCPTFHPAALLRDPRKKDDMLADMKKIKEKLSSV